MAIDIIFAIFAALGFYMGYTRGIIKTVFTVLSVTIGLVAAFKFAPPMTHFLESSFNTTNPLMFIAGFLLSFVLMMLLIRMLARALESMLETVHLNMINKVVGGAVLSALMILVYSILLQFADRSNTITDQTRVESISYYYLEQYPSQVWTLTEIMRPVFEDFWDHTVDFLDKVRDMGSDSLERTDSAPTIRDIDKEDSDY